MASYPTSIYTAAAKAAGQTIQAAHVNQLDDEVTAVETALITGPITLPTSTIANLSVPGNSTLVDVQITNSTITNLQVTNCTIVNLVGAREPGCKVTNSVAQDVPSGGASWTGLSWDTEIHDSTAMHSTASNSSRVLLNSSGMWTFGAQSVWRVAVSSAGVPFSRVMLNDNNAIACVQAFAGSTRCVQNMTGVYLATSTSDYLTVQVYLSGSSGAVGGVDSTGATDVGGSFLWAQRISQ